MSTKIIIGVDFGTTYSGVAWADTKFPDRRTAITVWPLNSAPVRENRRKRFRQSSDTPGAQLSGDSQFPSPLRKTRRLDPSQMPSFQVGPSLENQTHSAEKLTTDFLSALADHVNYVIGERIGKQFTKDTPIELVLTVPAIWSDLARDKTLKAAEKAFKLFGSPFGKVPIRLISEPEAAAIYSLHGLNTHGLEVDDTIVVMDAGGGTVDLISYTIAKLEPTLEIAEATPGTGGICGSSFLNRRFADHLKMKLGKLKNFNDEVLAEAVDYFERRVKRQFTTHTDPGEKYMIPVGGVPNNKALGVSRGRFALKVSEVRVIFEPVILECMQLVEEQIGACKKNVKAVLLVGGFPANAWQAVALGAVMHGFVKVQGRKARRHYGMELNPVYDESIHSILQESRFWDACDGCYRVPAMTWHIRRGDNVSEDKPELIDFFESRLVARRPTTNFTYLMLVDKNDRLAPLGKDDDVIEVCRLEADLSHIPEAAMARRRGKDGLWYYRIDFQIEVVYQSATTQYTLIHKGKRYDTVSAEYV